MNLVHLPARSFLVSTGWIIDDRAMGINVKHIGIAIVEHEGHYLVGVRAADQVLAGYSEFPGGKCLAQESSADCAVRECREETGLDVVAERLLEEVRHSYPHGDVKLDFWICRPAHAERVSADHQGYRWVPKGELASLTFPEANRSVIERLKD